MNDEEDKKLQKEQISEINLLKYKVSLAMISFKNYKNVDSINEEIYKAREHLDKCYGYLILCEMMLEGTMGRGAGIEHERK